MLSRIPFEAVVVAGLLALAGCSSDGGDQVGRAPAGSPPEKSSKPVRTSENGDSKPATKQVLLDPPTCGPVDGIPGIAEYRETHMGTYPERAGYREPSDVLGQVAHTSHRAPMEGGPSIDSKQLDEPVFGATLSYVIERCDKPVASLALGTDADFLRAVDSQPETVEKCREPSGPVISDLSIDAMLGKQFCFPTSDGAFYFAVEPGDGADAASPAPPIAITAAIYQTGS